MVHINPIYLKPEWMIVWVTIVYTAVSTLTLIVIGWQVWISKDAAKRQLRAYLTVKGAKLVVNHGGFVEPRVTFINSGQTPAYDIEGIECGRFEVRPFHKATPPDRGVLPHTSIGSVGGGEPYYFTGRKVPVSDQQWKLLTQTQDLDFAFILEGWYTYRDIFKNSHVIEFRLFIGGGSPLQRDQDDNGEWLVFFNDAVGNTAD